MTTYAEFPKTHLCRCRSSMSCEQVSEECQQIINICGMTDNEYSEFAQKSNDNDMLHGRINRSLNKTNSCEFKYAFIVGHIKENTKENITIFEKKMDSLYEQGYNCFIFGTCDELDFLIAEKINDFNLNHEENPIVTVCLHSTSDVWTNAIKKNMYYSCVIDFENNKNVYGPLMLLYVDCILSFNCESTRDDELLKKLMKCRSKVKQNIKLIELNKE